MRCPGVDLSNDKHPCAGAQLLWLLIFQDYNFVSTLALCSRINTSSQGVPKVKI